MDKMILGYLMNASEAHNVKILYAAGHGASRLRIPTMMYGLSMRVLWNII